MREDRGRNEFYIDDYGVLFGLIAAKCEERLGEKGLETCRRGVAVMGRERGLRSAMRCIENGDELNMHNFFCYGELLDDRGWNRVEVAEYGPVYRTDTICCAWYEAWKKYGLLKYAGLYCDEIDKNLLYGFNPELRLKVEQYEAEGGRRCGFRWLDCRFEDEDAWRRLMEKRAGMVHKVTRDFLYETGHLLAVMRRELLLEYGAVGAGAVIDGALEEYRRLFGQEKEEAVRKESERNFLVL